jgi:pimeloyl-ACP methyl ester carboxylesterase
MTQPAPTALPAATVHLVPTHVGDVRVRVVGEGPPLLFLHGALVDSRLWDPLVVELAPHFQCLLPDLPLGSQPVPVDDDADLSIAGITRLLLEIAAAFGVDRPTLVGNDSGGALGQMAVAAQPDAFERLVLTNCDALDVFPPAPYGVLLAVARRPWLLRPTMRLLHALPAVAIGMPAGYGPLAHHWDTALVKSWLAPGAHDRRVATAMARVFGPLSAADTTRAAERLADVDLPIHLLWGGDDRYFTVALAERLQAKVGATLDIIEGARTFVMRDQPAALAARLLRRLAPTAGSRHQNAAAA